MTTMTRSEESTATTAVPRHAAQNDPAVGGPRLILEVLSPSRPANPTSPVQALDTSLFNGLASIVGTTFTRAVERC